MIKNIVIVVLILAAVVEGFFLFKHSSASQQTAMTQTTSGKNFPPAGPNARGHGGPPIMLSKGMNLKTSPIFKYAYQIAPGTLSDTAKKALTGWKIATTKKSDGSLTVSLTPTDSDDQSQQYIVKPGNSLYFIEQTPADDKAGQDKDLNYRDDYGIILDKNNNIQ
ncbi:MAG TPA: hypothetical protein VND99_01585 [Candidatus Acidoferrales bacterium]|nr:hypothetical protein [Candidatus Acidoferrales bacterium]